MDKTSEERFVLAVGAVLIALASLVGVLAVSIFLGYLLPRIQIIPGEPVINSDDLASYLPLLLYFVVAGTWTYFVWDATNSTWRRSWLYGIAVLFFGSLSVANYFGGDALIPVRWQALINIPFVFVSVVCIASLWTASFTVLEAKILKLMTLFTLATFGVILPTVFSIFYVAFRFGMMDMDDLKTDFISGATYTLSALLGIAVSALNYLIMKWIKKRTARPAASI
ncbi:hypothetical protein [Rhizobium ruizarguesonis]|uniref:hypothetical protein n=1 Tax=Rhizobium ruizarguesonis TaxID=2081791 RepID=UPI0013C94BB2|nr:hypothetical protein [Rhizobium ruizarguesonis]NEH27442.1 hypothetical protein [Rhizobium ruizarguesonis]